MSSKLTIVHWHKIKRHSVCNELMSGKLIIVHWHKIKRHSVFTLKAVKSTQLFQLYIVPSQHILLLISAELISLLCNNSDQLPRTVLDLGVHFQSEAVSTNYQKKHSKINKICYPMQ